jgi:EAL domain-containing protein (putative c-di-GMP-specific phosphodiesterase class I)
MPSSTTAQASHHLLLRAAAARAQRRYRDAGRPPDGLALSSPAGLHRRPWLARLRRALENGHFELHYQPIVSLHDGAVSHHEALVRLADEPHGRLVAPGSFLPAAERYGLVRDIDRFVLGRVAAALATEPGCGRPVAINVSTLSATDGTMLRSIERALARNCVDPERLIVEVTETAAISDMGRARAFCEGARSLGCAVALDDFGSGFGSFQYLKHLPFDFLKIDGDFIRSLPSSPTDQLVVKALVDVVAGMGRRTIAEFVGDAATLELLREFGVDYAQGFQIGMPAPRMTVTV